MEKPGTGCFTCFSLQQTTDSAPSTPTTRASLAIGRHHTRKRPSFSLLMLGGDKLAGFVYQFLYEMFVEGPGSG